LHNRRTYLYRNLLFIPPIGGWSTGDWTVGKTTPDGREDWSRTPTGPPTPRPPWGRP